MRGRRRRLGYALPALLLGVTSPALRGDEPPIAWKQPVGRMEEPPQRPLALARLYASGRRAEAIAQLEGWSESDLKAELAALRAQMNKMGGRLPEGDLRAAVMLHTDRENYERLQSPVVESVRECGVNQHGGYARALISLLMVQSDATRDFARRWLLAMAFSSQWDLCLDDVRRWTHEGLKWFPRDADFLLAQATAAEVSASLTPVPVLFANPGNRTQGLTDIARRRQELAEAKRDLEAALVAQPDLQEARVRLGRVLWRVERLDEARVPLQAALDRAQEPWILYLAHLFLGRVLEDGQDLPGAVEHYRAALAIDPGAQAAAMGLSQALLLSGDDVEGRAVLTQALRQVPRGHPRDAYMSYYLGHASLAEGMLDALREETLQ